MEKIVAKLPECKMTPVEIRALRPKKLTLKRMKWIENVSGFNILSERDWTLIFDAKIGSIALLCWHMVAPEAVYGNVNRERYFEALETGGDLAAVYCAAHLEIAKVVEHTLPACRAAAAGKCKKWYDAANANAARIDAQYFGAEGGAE